MNMQFDSFRVAPILRDVTINMRLLQSREISILKHEFDLFQQTTILAKSTEPERFTCL